MNTTAGDGGKWASGVVFTTGQVIDEMNMKKMRKFQRRRTAEHVDYAKTAAEDAFEERPTDARFWSSLKHKDITRNVRHIVDDGT